MNALLVAYDIPDDLRRAHVAKELVKVGRRVQYSVFWVPEQRAEHVARLVGAWLELAEDDVRIHPLCVACEGKAVLLGRAGSGALPAGFRVI